MGAGIDCKDCKEEPLLESIESAPTPGPCLGDNGLTFADKIVLVAWLVAIAGVDVLEGASGEAAAGVEEFMLAEAFTIAPLFRVTSMGFKATDFVRGGRIVPWRGAEEAPPEGRSELLREPEPLPSAAPLGETMVMDEAVGTEPMRTSVC